MIIELLLIAAAPEGTHPAFVDGAEMAISAMPNSGVYSEFDYGRDLDAMTADCLENAAALTAQLKALYAADWVASCQIEVMGEAAQMVGL